VPAPVPPPAESIPSTTPQPGSEIEQLRLNWKQVIEQAPEDTKRTPAIAILRSAGVKPVALENDTVVLAFRYPLHKEKIEEPENQRVAEKIIGNFLGHSCQVRCIYEPETNHLVQAAKQMGAQITSVEEK
jgi:DNA polymerase-3 subunit gamma/tau